MIKKVLGPPGTGKTMTLLNEVNNYLMKGVPLNKIGYFAFTRKAAAEFSFFFLVNYQFFPKTSAFSQIFLFKITGHKKSPDFLKYLYFLQMLPDFWQPL